MKVRGWLMSVLLLAGSSALVSAQVSQNASKVEERVKSILSQMTLDEKIGQMVQVDPGAFPTQEALEKAVAEGRVGSLLNVVGADKVNKIQKVAMEKSRMKIPVIIGRDVIHGYRTIFPIPLGMAASWDESLIQKSAAIAAQEASSMGIRWTFSPMVDVSRDPRWGRIAESGGEDVLINSMVARAMVKGYQGNDMSNPSSIAACVKHFVGYGAAEGGRDYNTTIIPDIYMHNVYLPPFKEAVKAGAATFMSAFNDINGVPASGNEYTIRQTLKNSYQFDGFVVSDWGSIAEMITHGYCANGRDAALAAIKAGVDMEMASGTYVENLKSLLNDGSVKMEWIDDAVSRILRIKLRLGLFDQPYTDENLAKTALVTADNLAVARKLAAESSVLLKNEKSILPLKKGTRIALIGPLAHQPYEQLGTWIFDGKEENSVTVRDAFYQINGQDKTFFAEGLAYSRDMKTTGFNDVSAAIDKVEVVVAVMGEEAILSGEAKSLAELKLPGKQEELLALAASKGKPVVLVVMAGRPTGLAPVQHLADAILYTWHPGTMAGPAIADLIFGDVVPSGKLPVTFPRGEGQIPIYYAHKMTGRPASAQNWTYINDIPVHAVQHSTGNTSHTLDYGFTPLYPFGFGLSYTTFAYSDIKLSSNEIAKDGSVKVTAVITNTGKVAGDEIVQLYIRDMVASYTRPVRELKGFQRITLKAGESKTVEFTLGAQELGFYFPDGQFVVEPGDFKVWVAPNAAEGLEGSFKVK
jgi:beta-glucosidase